MKRSTQRLIHFLCLTRAIHSGHVGQYECRRLAFRAFRKAL